jgi:hypothetical protein
MVAYSWPRIFSVRSPSSRPPNQSCEPFGSSSKPSMRCDLALIPGKHLRMTFGNVSSHTDERSALAWCLTNR